jgi:hypothetical protein
MAIITYLILLILIILILFYSPNICKERPQKDSYGEPPGMKRSMKFSDMPHRGWSELNHIDTANNPGRMKKYMYMSA